MILKFMGGNIEFYPARILSYDKKYLRKSTGDVLEFNGYDGRIGLNDCVVGVYDDANIAGYLHRPAYIDTSGDVDIIIHPSMELSVRTTKQGFVDDVVMTNHAGRYAHGLPITEYAEYYFSDLFGSSNFDIDKNQESFFARKGKQRHKVTFLDLCAESNLVCLDTVKSEHISLIRRGYSKEYAAIANIVELHNILNNSLEKEDYELAEVAKREIKRIRETG